MLTLDETAVVEIRDKFLDVIKAHYLARGLAPERVFEVLNGLGIAAATVIGGMAPDHEHGWIFLDATVEQHLPGCIAAADAIVIHDGGTSAH